MDALGVLGPVCPLLACVREGVSCAAACADGRSRELCAFRDRGGGDAKRVKWWTAKGSNCSGRMEEGMMAVGMMAVAYNRAARLSSGRRAYEPGQRRVKARVRSGYALLRNRYARLVTYIRRTQLLTP